MQDQVNTVHHKNWLDNTLPDKSVNLLIADPPYYKVKGEFDFIWKTFDDYLADVEKWAIECKRVLADNGTLFWWGDAKNIAYSQIIFDKYFNLLNNITWEKEDCQTRKSEVKTMRRFAPVTERLLFYDNGDQKSGRERIDDDNTLFTPIKQFFDDWLDSSGLTLKEATDKIGSSCTHWFGFSKRDKTQFSFPTLDKWERMNNIHPTKQSYDELRQSYDELRQSYDELRRPFNLDKMITDVFHYGQEAHITKNYNHDTKKPETLTSALILTCSKKGDIVAVPFVGSGTECAISARYQRPFYGYEIEAKHVKTATDRVKPELMQGVLF